MNGMRIKKFVRGDTVIRYVLEGTDDGEPQEKSEKQWHPPNPALDAALQSLAKAVCSWMEVTAKLWGSIMTVTGVTLKRTSAGTRSASITFSLALDKQGGDRSTYHTPYVRIDPPQDGEDDKPLADQKEIDLLEAALKAAQDYIDGNWQPGRLGAGGVDAEEGTAPKTESLFDA